MTNLTVRAGAAAVCLAAQAAAVSPSRAHDAAAPMASPRPLPSDLRLYLADGEFHVAPPTAMCEYPEQQRPDLNRSMPGYRVMMAASSCVQGDAGRPRVLSTLLAMSDRDIDPKTRSSKAEFLKECFLYFSPEKPLLQSAKDFVAFNKGGFGVSVSNTRSVGLLRLTPDAIFGGNLIAKAQGNHPYVVTQVFACTVLSGCPLTWIFQVTHIGRNDQESEADGFMQLLTEAMQQVSASQRLNPR